MAAAGGGIWWSLPPAVDTDKYVEITADPFEPLSDAVVESARGLGMTVTDYPRFSRSTSATPLADRLVATVTGCRLRWSLTHDDERITWVSTSRQDLTNYGGTHRAYTALIAPATAEIRHPSHFIIVARSPSADEIALMHEHGVTLEVAPIGLDALVFIAHTNQRVTSLTQEQAVGIYAGEIENWAEVGGANEVIYRVDRNANSGSRVLLERLVMQGTPVTWGDTIEVEGGNSMWDPIRIVDQQPRAIGYTVFYYQRVMMAPATSWDFARAGQEDFQIKRGDRTYRLRSTRKTLAIDGVTPTLESLADGSYPYVAPIYAAIRADASEDAPERRLRDWLLTDIGQAFIAASGYAPILAPADRRVQRIGPGHEPTPN